MSRRRSLSDDEHDLWSGFTRSITPLRRSRQPKPPPTGDEPAGDDTLGETTPASPPPTAAHQAPAKKAPPLVSLGRRLKQRVARGREPIEARLDLHGFTQTEAHAALLRFLRRAQADGVKIALVVTGKGAARGEGNVAPARGVLKRSVPMWLALPEFRSLVVGFEDAHVGHGGQGALYIRLRRAR